MGQCLTYVKNFSTPPPSYQTVYFNEIEVRPFDVLLFTSKDKISKLIANVQKMRTKNGAFSHTALVVTGEMMGFADNDLYTWEITMGGRMNDGITDVNGQSFLGVQNRKLSEVIEHYGQNGSDKKVALLRNKTDLFSNIDDSQKEELLRRVGLLKSQVNYSPYITNGCLLVKSVFHAPRGLDDNIPKRFFCSQFVAFVLQKMGILNEKVKCEFVIPVDFIPGVDTDNEVNCCEEPVYVQFRRPEEVKDLEIVDNSSIELKVIPEEPPQIVQADKVEKEEKKD